MSQDFVLANYSSESSCTHSLTFASVKKRYQTMQCLLNVYDRAKEKTNVSRTGNENIQLPQKSGANRACADSLFIEKIAWE